MPSTFSLDIDWDKFHKKFNNSMDALTKSIEKAKEEELQEVEHVFINEDDATLMMKIKRLFIYQEKRSFH